MSLHRLRLVVGLDLREAVRRPLFWIWVAMMAGNAWLLSRGSWIYRSVDTSLGSPRARVDSEFQIAFVVALLGWLMASFFVAVAAGMPLIRDEERKVGEILNSTPLSPAEYVWGKFLAALVVCLGAAAAFLLALALFNHGLADAAAPETYGPFDAASYLRPVLLLLLPGMVFMAGAAFALGRFTGRPIVVFLLPVVILPFLQNLVWRWFPPDLGPAAGAALRYLDPAGFRWLKETWLRVDRGIAFYNTQPIRYDAAFLASRVAFVLLGLALVDLARRHFAGRLRRAGRAPRSLRASQPRPLRRGRAPGSAPPEALAPALAPLAALRMRSRPPGRLAGAWTVARFELTELVSQPGLYIFLPLILLVLMVELGAGAGAFNAPLLVTPGTAAVGGLRVLTPLICLLLLFYTVESLQRESSTGAAPIYYATPVPTGSILAGKALANGAVAVVSLAAAAVAAVLVIASQGQVTPALWPFLLVWGVLLLPTFALWVAFVTVMFALTRSRYTTYGIGIAALVGTLTLSLRGHMTWVSNWPLVEALRWSDMATFALDRRALWLNRLEVLALVPLLAYLAVRRFARRAADPMSSGASREAPQQSQRARWRVVALATLPAACGIALAFEVDKGFQGAAAVRRHKEYWRQNVATWAREPLPYVTRVEMSLDLDPAERRFRVDGFYDLLNRRAAALPWFPMTGGIAWTDLSWTLDGRPCRPEEREERTGLFLFKEPIAPGATRRLGFRYRGVLLPGISRNGGPVPLGEFIVPAGVNVTGRNPDFVPLVGFREDVGIDDENRHEPRRYAPDFYRQALDANLDRSAFAFRLRVSAPAAYTITSTGTQVSETVQGGRRTAVWESDYPLRVFNVAAGRWAVRRGRGTAVYYHPGHPYNVGSMLEGLDGARRWYAEWFGPYPWRELRLNEFAALAEYARGNATNIFFSEGVGFLTQRTPVSDLAFAVTAHEAAHQWWGHILAPGEGPGGIVLAEGAANFSTLLLLEQVRGPAARLDFARRIEAVYGETRQPSSEKPLADTIAFRPSDETVIYDKGGWAFWMLLRQMGREAFFAGARHFIADWHGRLDHPVLQHFLAAMRPYAADPRGFDAVADQWFFQTVIPEYRIVEARTLRLAPASEQGNREGDSANPRNREGDSANPRNRTGDSAKTSWEVVARVANAGTGRMPVEVAAASSGDRFGEDGRPAPGYRDARVTVVLGAGEEKDVRIRCPFEPKRLVVDPDANVMQLQRKAAAMRL
jgi:ABC-2 type transport system permease protein